MRVLLVDHEDSFVHTLGSYFRLAGADVSTLRPDLAREVLTDGSPLELLVLSPGPGRPSDFDMNGTLKLACRRRLPVFGICLGLQGIVEYFGGALDTLDLPMHGKASEVEVLGGMLFRGLPRRFNAGRYHSIHARRTILPDELQVTAEADGGVVMAVEHKELPIAAVQFHPESILTVSGVGRSIIENVLGWCA